MSVENKFNQVVSRLSECANGNICGSLNKRLLGRLHNREKKAMYRLSDIVAMLYLLPYSSDPDAGDCCLTDKDLDLMLCHLDNACNCRKGKVGFPEYPEPSEPVDPEPECGCQDGLTVIFPFDQDDENYLLMSIELAFDDIDSNGNCVFTHDTFGAEGSIQFNVFENRWEWVGGGELIAYSPELYGQQWQMTGFDQPGPMRVTCGMTADKACFTVISENGVVQHKLYPAYLYDVGTGGETAIGFTGLGFAAVLYGVDGVSEWLITAVDNGSNTCWDDVEVMGDRWDVPYGIHVNACGWKYIIKEGECGDLTPCELLFGYPTVRFMGVDGEHQIEIVSMGGTGSHTVKWFDDPNRANLIHEGTVFSQAFCGTEYWFTLVDDDDCTFESSIVVSCP